MLLLSRLLIIIIIAGKFQYEGKCPTVITISVILALVLYVWMYSTGSSAYESQKPLTSITLPTSSPYLLTYLPLLLLHLTSPSKTPSFLTLTFSSFQSLHIVTKTNQEYCSSSLEILSNYQHLRQTVVTSQP